jgi:hypothetical protein
VKILLSARARQVANSSVFPSLTDAPAAPSVVASSPTIIRDVVSGDDLANVVHAYSQSVRWTYVCAIPVAILAVVCALFVKNRPLGPPKKPKSAEDPEKGQTASKAVPSSSQQPVRHDSQSTVGKA